MYLYILYNVFPYVYFNPTETKSCLVSSTPLLIPQVCYTERHPTASITLTFLANAVSPVAYIQVRARRVDGTGSVPF